MLGLPTSMSTSSDDVGDFLANRSNTSLVLKKIQSYWTPAPIPDTVVNIETTSCFGTIWCILLPHRSIWQDSFTVESNGRNLSGSTFLFAFVIIIQTEHEYQLTRTSHVVSAYVPIESVTRTKTVHVIFSDPWPCGIMEDPSGSTTEGPEMKCITYKFFKWNPWNLKITFYFTKKLIFWYEKKVHFSKYD